MTENPGTVELRLHAPPALAVLFCHLLNLQDRPDFWEALTFACQSQAISMYRREPGDDADRDAEVEARLSTLVEELHRTAEITDRLAHVEVTE